MTWEEVKQHRAINSALNVGVVLGLDLIDVEIDSEEAAKTYEEWFAGIITPCWKAARGCHYLYRCNPRLSHLSAVVKTHGLEFRLGNGGQTQSIYPPSVVDGVQRTWIIPLGECEIPDLPESVVQELLKQPAAKQHKIVAADIPAAKNRTVKRLLDYCRRVGIVVKGVYVEPDGTVYIDVVCPFKHPDNVTGDAAFIVNPDGSFGFHCFHAGCAPKTKADVFDLLGPLYPRVVVGSDLSRTVEQSIQGLDDTCYQSGRVLTEICEYPPTPKHCLIDPGGPAIVPISRATLRAKLSDCVNYVKWKKDDYASCLPTDAIVDGVYSAGRYPGVRVITGIASTSDPFTRWQHHNDTWLSRRYRLLARHRQHVSAHDGAIASCCSVDRCSI